MEIRDEVRGGFHACQQQEEFEYPGGAVVGLTLELVETDEQRQVWNTLMAYEHPRGAGPFVGPQLRYLVGSAHGWLGGVGFAASARRLRSRDAWVGWDDTGRRAHLHRVLGLSGCWCAPASCAATWPRTCWAGPSGRSATTARVSIAPGCWRRVDETEQTGASVRAANWVRLRSGRQDRTRVYMYALDGAPAWVPAPVVAPLAVGDGAPRSGRSTSSAGRVWATRV